MGHLYIKHRTSLLVLFLILSASVLGQNTHKESKTEGLSKNMDKTDYMPQIHGLIRGKYEYNSIIDAHRFQVRNARLDVSGKIHPKVAYRAEIDLSDEGVTKMLNAYIRVFPVKGLYLSVGQMKIPFGTENMRSPYQLYLANRAFVAKQISSLRNIGFTAGYELKEIFPFSITAGIFNGTSFSNQKEWQKHMNYAARISFGNPEKYLISINAEGIRPDKTYMYLYDIGAYVRFFNFHIEAEYVYKHYDKNRFTPSQGINVFANYDLLLPKVFQKISFIARYDIITDNSKGIDNEYGTLTIDDIARQRVTAGITLSISKPFLADLRINYEKYFYKDINIAKKSEQDKFVIELVARF